MTDASVARMGLDRDTRSFRYFRNAVERHWDPGDIDLDADRAAAADLDEETFERLRAALAKFGAGEQAVTEDLAPLGVVLEDAADQAFLTTQIYEEAKHMDFFDRYWRTVVTPVERERGLSVTEPTDDRWYVDGYDELFARTSTAMHRLLEEDTPETRAEAYCHYHLTVEGILAQTGYFGLHRSFNVDNPDLPSLPGLVEGLARIRSDEGRHVGFGMAKLQDLVDDGLDPQLLHDTVTELLPLVVETTTDRLATDAELEAAGESLPGPTADDLQSYAVEKHRERMGQITDLGADLPDVDELTRLEES
jgi:ribonucleoside-diphosphate reductase beta chain